MQKQWFHLWFLAVCWMSPAWARESRYTTLLDKAEDMLLVDPRQSLEQMEKWEQAIEADGQNDEILRLHIIAARSLGLMGRAEDMLRWAEPALHTYKDGISSRSMVQIHCVTGEALEFASQVEKGRMLMHEAIKRADASGVPWLRAYARNALAWMESRQSHHTEAVKLLTEAFQLIQDRLRDDLYADLLNNLGMIYRARSVDRRTEAEKLLLESLAYFESKGRTFYIATILYNLGLYYRDTDPGRSIPVLKRSLKSSESIHDVAGVAYAHYALAQAYGSLGQHEKSLEEITWALQGFEVTGNRMMLAEAMYRQLLALISMKQYGRANEILPLVEKKVRAGGSMENIIDMMRAKIVVLHAFHRVDEEIAAWSELYDTHVQSVKDQDNDSLNRLTSELDLARRDHENQIQAMELKRNRLDNQMKSRILLGALIALVLLVVGLGVVIRQMQKIRTLQQYVETNVLQRFLPPELVMEVRAGRSRLDEEAAIRRVTVIFADLVDFTSSTEQLGAAKSARVLNEFLMGMTDVIFSQGGTIDKFIGDAVMVLFGAPTEMDSQLQAARALTCALAMQTKLEELNEVWERDVGLRFAMRIGISQGEAMVGSFGSSKRSDYTAIGSTVNLAARIEAQALPNQILVSAAVAELIPADHCVSRGHFKLKGIQDEQELFEAA